MELDRSLRGWSMPHSNHSQMRYRTDRILRAPLDPRAVTREPDQMHSREGQTRGIVVQPRTKQILPLSEDVLHRKDRAAAGFFFRSSTNAFHVSQPAGVI